MTEKTTIPEPTASQIADRLKEGPASAAPDAFSQLCKQFDPAQVSAACAGRFWDEPARFWRLVGESPMLGVKPRQVKTIGLCYFRLGIGGAERVVAFLANLWTDMGYRVVLFCDEDPTDEDYEVPVTVERVKLPLFLDANAENYGGRAELLAAAIRSFDVDLMVYHQWLSHALPWDMLTCKLLDVPLLLFTHGVYGCMYRWSNRWEMQLPIVAGYSDGVIALDAADVRFWSEHCPRVWQTANPVTLLPDESKVSPLEGETIVWVGRLDPTQKQPAEALEIMRLVLQEVPTAKLLIVAWAKTNGVMNGYENGDKNGYFGPDDTITREQVACTLYNYAKSIAGVDVTVDDVDGALAAFPDGGNVSDWAREAVAWCVTNHIMGNGGYINPGNNISRAEMAAMMTNFQS